MPKRKRNSSKSCKKQRHRFQKIELNNPSKIYHSKKEKKEAVYRSKLMFELYKKFEAELLILLDGGGARITKNIKKFAKDENVEINIKRYEYDYQFYEESKKIYEDIDVESIHGNVLNHNFKKNHIPYLNYSGLGGEKGIKKNCDFLDKYFTKNNNAILISFSTRNLFKRKNYFLNFPKIIENENYYNKGWHKDRLKLWIGKKVSQKPNFVTYLINKK